MLREVCVKGWGCPESVKSWVTSLCECWLWDKVEKLGKGLGQPVEGQSQLLGYSLCGQLIFDVGRLESFVQNKVVPLRSSSKLALQLP